MTFVLTLIAAYLIGSIPFALLVARRRGIDLRVVGSRNIGAANVFRSTSPVLAAIVAALDISKGAFAVVLSQQLSPGDKTGAAAGLAAMLGHIFPVWLGFRGGKGVATACGVFAVLAPAAALSSVTIFVTVVSLSGYISLGSVAAILWLGPMSYLTRAPRPVVMAAVIAAAIVVERHRSNIARLQAGTEPRLGHRI